MRKRILLGFVVASALISNLPALAARNNILLVIADDYGTDSNSLYNTNSKASLPPTPNINSLYTNGVLFRNAYAYPSCSASRACMLTGRYGFRTGFGLAIGPSNPLKLLANEPTIPKLLSANPELGYRHALIGKWHLGNAATDPNVLGGWEHFSGSLYPAVENYFQWSKVVNGATTITTNYATTDSVNNAISWIAQQGTNSWFLWLAFNAPHDPFHKPPAGLHSYADLSTNQAAIKANPRPYYEAMTEAMDTEFGRLLGQIDRSNTTIIFIGDNGTPGEVVQPPFNADRAKFTLYEGGVRVPLIIAGPVVQNPQRENTSLVHAVDLFATILELAGADLKTVLPQRMPSDSRSLMPLLTNGVGFARDWAYVEQFPAFIVPDQDGRAIRDDLFKLIRLQNGFRGFYDLIADPYERTNLFGRTLTPEQSLHFNSLGAQLADLQNFPQITSRARFPNKFSISADYIQNVPFSLYRSDTLGGNSWRLVSPLIQRTNFTVTLTDRNATNVTSFYRVAAPSR
jgi:arylsulfatase A-like enzyme